jgi:hypothetical protein
VLPSCIQACRGQGFFCLLFPGRKKATGLEFDKLVSFSGVGSSREACPGAGTMRARRSVPWGCYYATALDIEVALNAADLGGL